MSLWTPKPLKEEAKTMQGEKDPHQLFPLLIFRSQKPLAFPYGFSFSGPWSVLRGVPLAVRTFLQL